MNESYSARKKGRGSKTDFRANLKNNTPFKSVRMSLK